MVRMAEGTGKREDKGEGMKDDIFSEGVDPAALEDVLYRAEVTVLGIGNVILKDEGFGVRVVEYLDSRYDFPESVQLVDGGTLGIELTQYVTGTKKLLVVDSINGGAEGGTRFHFENEEVMAHFQDKLSAHEVGIQDVLALLKVTGREIPEVAVIGAQPCDVSAGVELTPEMERLLPEVAEEALEILKSWGIRPVEKNMFPDWDLHRVAEENVKEDFGKI